MSRSYKHSCVGKERNDPFGKRASIRTVRRRDDIPDGASYKKHYCTYNICDYRTRPALFGESLRKFRDKWKHGKLSSRVNRLSWEEAYRIWYRWFMRK